MTNPRDFACLCYDSSYVLAEILQNEDARTRLGILSQYQKNLKLETFLSPTTKSECNARINEIKGLVANLIRDLQNYFKTMRSSSSSNISFKDTELVREFFISKMRLYDKNNSEKELLRRVEAFLINYMWEKLGLHTQRKYFELLTEMMVEILKFGNKIRDREYEFLLKIPTIASPIDQSLFESLKKDRILSKLVPKKINDLKIICEVESHQRNYHKWALLVTWDGKDMLNNAIHIDNLCKVKCVDPLYVPAMIDKLSSMSKP